MPIEDDPPPPPGLDYPGSPAGAGRSAPAEVGGGIGEAVGQGGFAPSGGFRKRGGFGSFGTLDLPPVQEPGNKAGRVYDPPPGGGIGGGWSGTSGPPRSGRGGSGSWGNPEDSLLLPEGGFGGIPVMTKRRWSTSRLPARPAAQNPVLNTGPRGYAEGGFVPGVTPGPPGPTDTVPAMLTPNEMVMNRGVTSDPTIAAVLTLLNILGAHHQGAAEEGNDCPHCGGKMEPGELPEPQGFRCGGHVKGFGLGGWIKKNVNMKNYADYLKFNAAVAGAAMGAQGGGGGAGGADPAAIAGLLKGAGQRAPEPPPIEAPPYQYGPQDISEYEEPQGYAFGGMVGSLGRSLNPFGKKGAVTTRQDMPAWANRLRGGTAGGAAAPGGNGYQYNPQGGVTGGFNPTDPWGPYRENRDPRVYGAAVRGLGGFGQAGYFDPRGNQALIGSMEEGARGTADALVRRQMSQADLGGLDPAQRAVAKLQAQRDTGRGVQDIMAQTRASALGSQNQFAQNLYRQLLGADVGFTGQAADEAARRQLAAQQQQQGGGLGGILGGIAGGFMP